MEVLQTVWQLKTLEIEEMNLGELKEKMNTSYDASLGFFSGIDVDVCLDQEDTK
ncbi:hypothetical protein [Coxiella endosymbiont of Ornithodoros amblus]|uniref:hypothetical protein n=1 Tax=Coxiella endosymbiont of Ornithodoros amblus TaxID=1656166 RepID=UPI00244DA978|nr:hypothetical protein [Coxiella endosymbiont of Ornithodoros amblus]